MNNPMDHPDAVMPPDVPGLFWRPLQHADLEAIASLAIVCLEADGGPRWPSAKGHVQERYLPDSPGTSIGAFEKGGQLVACAATQPSHATEEYQVTLVGWVHPAHRRRGLGTLLLKWSIAEGSRLLATCPPDRLRVLLLTAESLTEEAALLFERHGFVLQSTEYVMRRDLNTPLPNVLIPTGIRFHMWLPASAEGRTPRVAPDSLVICVRLWSGQSRCLQEGTPTETGRRDEPAEQPIPPAFSLGRLPLCTGKPSGSN